MEQYPQEISSLYAAVSDVETELIALQAKLLATRCNHELQGMSISRLPPPSTSSPTQRSCSPADADSGASISRLGISWRALKQFCSEHEDKLQGLTTKEVQDLIIKPATALIKGPYSSLHPEMFRKANVFVSHAWRYMFLTDLIAAIESWLETQALLSAADAFFWIDIFVVSQHNDPPEGQDSEEEARNFQIFSDGFEEALQDIGRAVIVLSPWNRPEWMFRIWCLFEFYVMMRFQIPFEFVLPQEQNDSFIKQLGGEGNDFLTMVSTLDMEEADAFSDYDKRRIKQLVLDHLGGYSQLNESAIGAIREFCIGKAIGAISTMTDEEKASNNLLENSGQMLSDLGDFETALQYLSEALQLKIGRHGPDDVEVAGTHLSIGEVFRHMGDFEKAMFHYNSALPVFISQLGEDHVYVASTLGNIANVLLNQGKLQESLETFQKVLAIFETALGGGHASVASTKNNVGQVLRKQGRLSEAMEMYQQAEDIWKRSLGESHPFFALALGNIAKIHLLQGRLVEARELLGRAKSIFELAVGQQHEYTKWASAKLTTIAI